MRKQTSLSLPRTDVRIRLSTLSVLVFAVPFMSVIWLFAGVVTVGIVAPESPDSAMIRTVVIAGLAIAFLAAIASGSVAADESIANLDLDMIGPPVLIGIVLVKLTFDLADLYSDRLVELDESSSLRLGFAYESPTEEPIDTSLSADETRLRPTLRARVLGGINQLVRQAGAWLIYRIKVNTPAFP